MDNQTLIDQLLEVRSNLRGVLREAEGISAKLNGPRPNETGHPEIAQESVGSLIDDIRGLSIYIGKTISEQHNILGNFQAAKSASQPARYA